MRSEAEIREAATLLAKHAHDLRGATSAFQVLELSVATALADTLHWVDGSESPSLAGLLADLRQKYPKATSD